MRVCISCGNRFGGSSWHCPHCHWDPHVQDSIAVLLPQSSGGDCGHEGFKIEFFSELAKLEARHFWFKSRNALIAGTLKRYLPRMNRFLEVGCGTGFVLSRVAEEYPSAHIIGGELFREGLMIAKNRVPHAEVIQIDARHIPFFDEFDAIGAFDVLEHIEEDTLVLGQIHNALRPGGIVVLTVPQHKWLWSRQDEAACHVRRYSATELEEKVVQAGFEPVWKTSFVTLLLPVMMISRLVLGMRKDVDAIKELQIPALLNLLFSLLMKAEQLFIGLNASLPIGGGLVYVARKK